VTEMIGTPEDKARYEELKDMDYFPAGVAEGSADAVQN
jgi:hypothetical protein